MLKGLRWNGHWLGLADTERRNSVVRRRNRHLWRHIPSLTSGGGFGGLANALLAGVPRGDEKWLNMLDELLLG